jgi:hypothetical protein
MVLTKKRILPVLAAFIASCLALSCAGSPKPAPAPTPPVEAPAAPVETITELPPTPASNPVEPSFDPTKVTAEVKTATFVDVRALIESLNLLIRQQDYNGWLSHLTDEYIAYYSDPEVLAKYSEYPIIKRKGIKLTTLKDYFVNVVYPSRQNDKVDDIEFVQGNLIKAITVNPKGERNILYMLEKHGDAWKIGIGR